ncbi:MAG TPA: DNA polymerase III subunit delta [Gammaproteobacteria bacterium]|nr:DNA polymerase III subunit delta [Gammaproteobacteria bacterium]
MQLAAEKLAAHLGGKLEPVYVVSGDEPLLVAEAADAIRTAARAQGYADREVFFVERGFDWNRLRAAGDSLSLFAARRLLEVKLPDGKPGDDGARVLAEYAARPAEETVLLVVCGAKIERGARWLAALEQAGVHVPVWPIDVARLPAWLERRARALGLELEAAALQLIAERVEGNLLAATQELDKLSLIHGPGPLTAADVEAAVAMSARYDLFQFVETAIAGEGERALRMLDGLRGEGVEPVLVLWALARELRALAGFARQKAQGVPMTRVLASVWERRRAATGRALERLPARAWGRLLQRAARADRVIKGMAPGEPWEELLDLTAGIAGLFTQRGRSRA